ncbi:unnamed protein product [Cylicocyclus nassatus]|uniref:Uncharacterized protein n=1 Tax=Cylicocyclus nassatus TaxID=53992 RepID=A0AA36LZ22_CYLNA|nr:unnamed protein product [Cylicocyclus nassatus]
MGASIRVRLNDNVLDACHSYRAASSAISSQVDFAEAKDMASYHYNALSKLNIRQGKISPNDFDAHFDPFHLAIELFVAMVDFAYLKDYFEESSILSLHSSTRNLWQSLSCFLKWILLYRI